MNSLLTWREKEYFDQRSDHYFIVETLRPMLMVAKLVVMNKMYWFDFSAYKLKATTARCASLKDLSSTELHYKGFPQIKGRLGEFGITDTHFVYVYWHTTPMFDEKGKLLGMPCALPHTHDLVFNTQ